jgi:tetratricopeptide (TPR) repeat protein
MNSALLAFLILVLILGLSLILWLIFGPGPRRARAFHRAQRLLEQDQWQEALAILEPIAEVSGLSEVWQGRLRNGLGECHSRAAEEALKQQHYEDALDHLLIAAPHLGQDETEQRVRVVESMLVEVRRRFAAGTGAAETQAVLQMVERTFALAADESKPRARPIICPEGLFWQGLCQVRQGQFDQARESLTRAFEQAGKQIIDPAFYLGVLLHRLGRPQEALRYLGEANRVDATCPFVTWQMGVSMIAAGGDSGLALRALQRALGPRGLPLWANQPERVWVEALPEARSYVRRLALKHRYICPLLGGDLPVIIRQGQLALAQALYRQDKFAEAADLFGKLLQESPPTVVLLRGYGLSLARLARYDQAYKHLRIALEQEEPKDPFTAGYLALCGAMGKPTQEEDRPKNILWAMRLLARYPVMGNTEWAGLISAVHAEARQVGLAISVEDQLLLCDTLSSVAATDPLAAASYSHLAATYPSAVRPMVAWLYAQAVTLHNITTPQDFDLLGRTFADVLAGPARDFFTQQKWDLDAVEYTYLSRSAAARPGHFPEVLGPSYPARGEAFLLARSETEEQAGRKEQARACVEVLLRLAPNNLPGHDRLACLHYRSGEMDPAVAILARWHHLAPHDPWPLVRQAIIEQERGNAERRAEAIDRALGLTRGPTRAAVAFLGARLALRDTMGMLQAQGLHPLGPSHAAEGGKPVDHGEVSPQGVQPLGFQHALSLLEACTREDANHIEALWCLAAVRSALADREGLANLAPLMNRPDVKDARFHYLGAVCHLAARDYPAALELGQRAAADESLAIESHYVMAWAHLHQNDLPAARASLAKVAAADHSPSAVYARALLGNLHFHRSAYDEAIGWWNRVDPRRRSEWGLDDPLRQTVLLAGLMAYENKRYEQAADRFREAGKLGLRDRRLGGLLTLALVKAGQRLLYSLSSE